ncbi:CaiB/BaiF CoA transferase family protein [Mycolicibacterium sp.]|uniref:CaiB/BaiF CoA transferase family protein n=1 Tax=Mycolicibacterium sp. TaxID=2320850 RepID=UPI003D140083
MTDPRPPLDGLVIVDFTRVLAGPLCTMLLSDLGAEVIKVERPGVGDDTRQWDPPSVGGDATYFLSVNRDKKSVALDLSTPHGREIATALMANADVVVENFRSGVMDRLGLGYDDVAALNPQVVYCSIPAFAGSSSPKPGYDLLMQAQSGLMSLTGTEVPTKAGVALLDVITGLYAITGILAALQARHRDGVGQQVTVGLYEASLAALVNQSAAYLMAGQTAGLAGNAHPSIVPYQVFSARDRSFVLAAGNDKLFRDTVEVLGRPELADDPRFSTNNVRVQHRELIVGILSDLFKAGDAEHWVRELDARGVPASLVRSLDEVFAAPESQGALVTVPDDVRGPLGYVRTPIRLSRTALRTPAQPPPHLGQHTDEILAFAERTRDNHNPGGTA